MQLDDISLYPEDKNDDEKPFPYLQLEATNNSVQQEIKLIIG